MGCEDTVLPEPLLRNGIVNCLSFEKNTLQPYKDNLCLFRALALHLHGNKKLEEDTSKTFIFFLNNSREKDPSKFQGVQMTDIPKVKDLLQLNIFPYDIDFVDGELIGELCRRSIQSYEKSVIFYDKTITFALSTTLTHCSKPSSVLRVTHFSRRRGIWNNIWLLVVIVFNIFYPKNVYELSQTLFEKLDAFNIPYRSEQKLFKNLAIFDFESISVKEENSYKETKTTTWIGKHVPYQFLPCQT